MKSYHENYVSGKRWRRQIWSIFLCILLMMPMFLSVHAKETMTSLQENVTVTGTITDATTGKPMAGVSVLIKGTTSGTITDMNGHYSISTNVGSVLVFSYMGYIEEEIEIAGQTEINIQMVEDLVGLDEVVVIGYGVQKKKLITGSSLNISGDDIQESNATTAMDALQGISPGVSITRTNGVPGSGTKVHIRGRGTIDEAEPLYIVDGIAVEDIDYLSPSDIESVDVLKDNATAAIYGSRAANGVILVTTKKGKAGTMQVTYDGYYGIQNPYKLPEMLNATQYAEIMNEARINSDVDPYDFAEPDLIPDWDRIVSGEWNGTNWMEEIQRKNAVIQSHSLSLTGGSERSTFSAGVSYLEEQGIFGKQINSTYKRLNLRLNSEHILWENASGMKIMVFGENLTYSNFKDPAIRTGNIYWNDLHNMLGASPFLPVYDEDGEIHGAIDWNSLESNPIGVMEIEGKHNTNNNNKIVGNAYLNIQPIKNLYFRTSFGIDNWYGSSRIYKPVYDLSTINFSDRDFVEQKMYEGYAWTATNTLTYTFDLNDMHNFNVMVGSEALKTARNLEMRSRNENTIFQTPDRGYLDNIEEVDPTYTFMEGKDEFGGGLLSYFGRILYDYKEKYLFTFVLRRDASSNFASGNRWGTFRSVAAGWVVSSEPFMDQFSGWLSYMKVRASWGQTGNEAIEPFQYLASIDYEDANYYFGPDKTVQWVGSHPPILPNPDVTWETAEDMNFGLDMYFLNNQLQFTFDLYKKDTRDWLVEAPVLASYGTGAPFINGGDITNKGLELMLRWNDREGAFKYGISGTFAYNHNEVMSIANEEGIIHGATDVLGNGTAELFRAEVGYPIGYFWGYKTDGLLQNEADVAAYVNAEGEPYFDDSAPGDVRFVDENGDGEIEELDKVMIGDPNPDVIFGLQFNAEFKGFYMQLVGNGEAGHQIVKSYRSPDSPRQNFTTDILDRWHGEGTSNNIPRVTYIAHPNFTYVSDLYIEDADFFRISNLTIGYNFNQLIKRLPFEQTRLYFAARNLVTFTKYSGMDPEVGYGPTDDDNPEDDYPWASGIDLGLYPVARTFMVGLSIKF